MNRSGKKSVLFLCVANSIRSQMAEGLARHFHGDRLKVQSAGSVPSFIHPVTIQVMHEIGIDISEQKSKSVQTIDPKSVEIVITLCAKEICPVFLTKVIRLHWPFPDPAASLGSDEKRLNAFRQVRDEIKKKIDEFLKSDC